MDLKQCTHPDCQKWYPNTEEYFYNIKKTTKKKGTFYELSNWCKECCKKNAYKNFVKNRGLYNKKTYNNYKNNKDKYDKRRTKWNRDNGEHIKDYRLEWQRNNKNKLKMYQQLRKHKDHIISKKEWKECKEYFNNCCAYCGIQEENAKKIYGQNFHKEHVNPDGSQFLDNCVPSCRDCNIKKWETQFIEWYNKDNPNYTKERYDKIIKWLNEDYLLYFEGYREKRKNNKKTK